MGFGAFKDAESSTDFVGLSWRFGGGVDDIVSLFVAGVWEVSGVERVLCADLLAVEEERCSTTPTN
jgi:hypothetical protein